MSASDHLQSLVAEDWHAATHPAFTNALADGTLPSAAPAAPETVAFQQLMDQARRSGRYEIMLSVLVVAEWIYLDWASPFEDRAEVLPFWLGEWITLHSGDGFTQVVAYLRGQLDQAWDTLDDAARADVTGTFAQAVRLERAFFDASWAGFTVEK